MTKDKASKSLLPDNSSLAVNRAIHELRQGRPVMLDSMLVFPAEFANEEAVRGLKKLAGVMPEIAISSVRAASIGLSKQDVSVNLDKPSDIKKMEWVYNPLVQRPSSSKEAASLDTGFRRYDGIGVFELMKIAELLPSALVAKPKKKLDGWIALKKNDITKFSKLAGKNLEEVVRANVPLSHGNAEVVLFRPKSGGHEHMAVVFGKVAGKTPLVRIHSSCITGDILSSLKCDCGEQLSLAARNIAASGCGILVYVNQEGKGIGFANKLRSYNLQEQGADTIDANEILGFEADERDFDIAAEILKKLGVKKIKILTNNPKKMEGLKKLGIKVEGRQSLIAAENEKNKSYLRTKASRAGHLL